MLSAGVDTLHQELLAGFEIGEVGSRLIGGAER
jgi:hypothetical protein